MWSTFVIVFPGFKKVGEFGDTLFPERMHHLRHFKATASDGYGNVECSSYIPPSATWKPRFFSYTQNISYTGTLLLLFLLLLYHPRYVIPVVDISSLTKLPKIEQQCMGKCASSIWKGDRIFCNKNTIQTSH